ncbi:Pentatricopeptide repeat-containing protein [Heracleum sosnowskyi]|uniref:Pentatricopeptide repeat-containing protein n=1 Tax=Heracleum sosnowskyi TaxID=360622 RepID=A0AAD8H7V7_9APIA|nr:Pentatricopeptide repeat-containing protein [Heracleum sosnowskyi]
MISGYVKIGKARNSLDLYWRMVGEDVEPNGFTLSSVIKACSVLGELSLGRGFHGVVFRRGFDTNNVIVSSLIDMYGKNKESSDALRLFGEMVEPDSICCTSVISACTRVDLYEEALGFFYMTQRKYRFVPDEYTFGSILMACGNLGRLKQGKEVHAKVILVGETSNVVVGSSLVDMYGKCGSVTNARLVFDRMTRKNAVTLSALLNAYCQKGLAAVRQAKEVHCQYLRRGGWRDIVVESALVDVYSKCGCIDFAYRIFKQMVLRNLVTWNSMICGLAQNGRGMETLKALNDMIEEGTVPDYITFVGVLFACSHAGLVDEGRKNFNSMTEEYGIKAGVEHYNCMVDLLGRAGQIEEAESLLNKSDVSTDSSLWAALLGACATSRNSTAAERIAKKMMELEPNNHLSYVLLANVYRDVGRWSDADRIRKLMQDRGVKKIIPGKSWIDIQGSLTLGCVYSFAYINSKEPDSQALANIKHWIMNIYCDDDMM